MREQLHGPARHDKFKPKAPAKKVQIKKIEDTFNIKLPEDYKAFLLTHNGWEQYEVNSSLLSTDEILKDGGIYLDRKGLLECLSDDGVKNRLEKGLIIEEISSEGGYAVFYDLANEKKGNQLKLILLGFDETEYVYDSFTQYFKHKIDRMRNRLNS